MDNRPIYEEYLSLLDYVFNGVSVPVLSNNVVGRRKGACEFDDKGRITTLNISQTLIKRVLFKGEERPDVCPRQLYETILTGNYQFPKSKAMEEGIYFETKLLGAGAYESVDELRRNLRTGKKTAIQERLDETIALARKVFVDTGIIISERNTQVKGLKPFLEHNFEGVKVFLKVIGDIVSPFTYKNIDYPVACIDVKLSKDVTNDFSDKRFPWKYYPWGNPELMDHTQAYLYSAVLEMPFLYLVFDSKTPPGWKAVPVETTYSNPDSIEARNRHRELIRNIKWVIEKISLWQEGGWPTESSDMCIKCPVYECESHKIVRLT